MYFFDGEGDAPQTDAPAMDPAPEAAPAEPEAPAAPEAAPAEPEAPAPTEEAAA